MENMKRRILKLVQFLSASSLPVLAIAPRVCAQTPAGFDIQMYPGLTITVAVGTVYAIQATADLAQPNNWICLGFIRLPATNHLWLDSTARTTGQRFYRAVTITPTNMVFIPPGTFRIGSL